MDATAIVYAAILLLALYGFAEWYAPHDDLSDEHCVVSHVYDGDTVELTCGVERVTARLQGFDTPETREPGCAAEAELGAQATERLQDLIASGSVSLDLWGYDSFDRALTTLRVAGQDVGDILVSEGLAIPYHGGRRINWCERLGA